MSCVSLTFFLDIFLSKANQVLMDTVRQLGERAQLSRPVAIHLQNKVQLVPWFFG
jgi:hypothetical protein